MSAIWAVVPAAGSGSRLGADTPKQYLMIRGRPLLHWSVQALLGHPRVEGCVVAVPAGDSARAKAAVPDDDRLALCTGGAERADSVAAAIDSLVASLGADDRDWVLVHDAARPCLAMEDLDRLVTLVSDSGVGGILAEPVADTLKRVDEHLRVTETVDRSSLWRAQTPQMFRIGELRAALHAANATTSAATSSATSNELPAVTDEASAMEWSGHPVQLIAASAYNGKVTYTEDLELAAACLSQREEPGASTMARVTEAR